MTQQLNRRLTRQDAAFFYLDRPTQPQHVGGVPGPAAVAAEMPAVAGTEAHGRRTRARREATVMRR